ncbi:putative prophage CPS-53 integrase [Mariprofundus micogutta]|uniref:Putative prophage CPS-53 integrase n=1 Tax=Mariprofundus micogutta TaxID=1921010 RepID=A0A1L8CLY1_9PROT|nr:integrase arm-type DNA-binding domain-containing protein [Mariprofundus micogutta]GAV19913.1 putative prophage CPS-53 integrase [Mariprofundus micogutta]
MKLSDMKVKSAALPEGKRQVRLSDGGGLYLQVTNAGKYWRMNYRFGGKQKTLAIGVYPSVTLKEARTKRDEAKKLLELNIDPSQAKQHDRREKQSQRMALTFEGVSKEWLIKNKVKWVPEYTNRIQNWLNNDICPWIGSLPIDEIKAVDVLAVLRKAEDRGAVDTAHKLRSICGQVFRYAVATARIDSDPSRDLRGALEPKVVSHRATITDPKKVGELLRAIQSFEGTFIVQCAMKITPYLFVRPGELRQAEWSEINIEKAEWRIPAEKMKMKQVHIVPLSDQVITILRDAHALTGEGKYVFPSIRSAARPMSNNTVNSALRRLGYDKSEICAHGFRGMASTILHEQGWPTDVIERQLAHQEGNEVKRSYNHARHLPERQKMMQHWADYLDGLCAGADVIPIMRRS